MPKCALDDGGRIVALRGAVDVDIGAYVRPNGTVPIKNVAQFMVGPYRVPNVSIVACGYVSNKTPASVYRVPGRFESCFFLERLLQMAAVGMGLDQADIRRRNLVTDDEI